MTKVLAVRRYALKQTQSTLFECVSLLPTPFSPQLQHIALRHRSPPATSFDHQHSSHHRRKRHAARRRHRIGRRRRRQAPDDGSDQFGRPHGGGRLAERGGQRQRNGQHRAGARTQAERADHAAADVPRASAQSGEYNQPTRTTSRENRFSRCLYISISVYSSLGRVGR